MAPISSKCFMSILGLSILILIIDEQCVIVLPVLKRLMEDLRCGGRDALSNPATR